MLNIYFGVHRMSDLRQYLDCLQGRIHGEAMVRALEAVVTGEHFGP